MIFGFQYKHSVDSNGTTKNWISSIRRHSKLLSFHTNFLICKLFFYISFHFDWGFFGFQLSPLWTSLQYFGKFMMVFFSHDFIYRELLLHEVLSEHHSQSRNVAQQRLQKVRQSCEHELSSTLIHFVGLQCSLPLYSAVKVLNLYAVFIPRKLVAAPSLTDQLENQCVTGTIHIAG